MTPEEKEKYRKYLENLAKSGSPELFSNGGKEHAVILYTVLLNHTHKSCNIFCEGCTSDIWKDPGFQSAFIDALGRLDTIRILTHQNSHPELAWIPSELESRLSVKVASEKSMDVIRTYYPDQECNFSIFDSKMFRFEYDVKGYHAFGSFNDAEVVGMFEEIFKESYAVATPAADVVE